MVLESYGYGVTCGTSNGTSATMYFEGPFSRNFPGG
jgi:hypothetical protein